MGKVASQAPSGHKLITYRATFLFQFASTAVLAPSGHRLIAYRATFLFQFANTAALAPSGHRLITYRATFLFQLANTALALTQKVALRCHGPRKHMVQLSYGATFLMCTYPESCVQGDPRKHMVQLSYYEGCKKKLFPELDWRIEIYVVTLFCERSVIPIFILLFRH